MAAPLVGIFVGGKGTRMGGRDKSQLPAPGGGESLLSRWLRVCEEAGLGDVVLVGGDGAAPRPRLADDPPGIGPLGGLHALVQRAGERSVITVACDMPYVQAPLLRRLAGEAPGAAALAALDPTSGKWQAMFVRYDAARALAVVREALAAKRSALQPVLRELGAQELKLDDTEQAQLRDWDTPEDMER